MTRGSHLLSSIPVGAKAPLGIPDELERLSDLAYNLWWSWDPLAEELWRSIEPGRWEQTQNPLVLCPQCTRSRWRELVADAGYRGHYEQVIDRFDTYLTESTQVPSAAEGLPQPVAYFSAEFGFHQSLPLYSGGLGILAGDHVKAASDLSIPLIGVGLFYRRGYFRQAVDPDGRQQHSYVRLESRRRPAREVLDPGSGDPLRVTVRVADMDIAVGAWRVDVGRVPVLLLDTDVEENDVAARSITHILYVRGREMRFTQETILGIGGARTLAALGIAPAVWHINEGHAALGLLECVSAELDGGGDIAQASARVSQKTLFTLHTPLPAGNEVFDYSITRSQLANTIAGVEPEAAERLANDGKQNERFDLGALAIRLSAITNGVSRRHAAVATAEWGHLLEGGVALAITNGIHPQTWLGVEVRQLLADTMGLVWASPPPADENWERLLELPDRALWEAHLAQKGMMLRKVRARLREQLLRHGASLHKMRALPAALSDDKLTLAFARRFASYKRPLLLLEDRARLTTLLTNPARPVQIVFTGKAHPADRAGQGLVQEVMQLATSAELEECVFFIENYDIELAKALVAGADAWLNTPLPPYEASGTSGMKSAANGGLNVSGLDGWWLEGWNDRNGWGFEAESGTDAADAALLYDILEQQVVPAFYERGADDLPHRWLPRMKEAMVTALSQFTTHRMVREYVEKAYVPLATGRR